MKQALQIREDDVKHSGADGLANSRIPHEATEISVTLLTGGGDRPYVYGLATELVSKHAAVDLIGSDHVDYPEFHGHASMNFLNLRGDQSPDSSLADKVSRVAKYYAKLIRYALTAKPRIFHILWNNKFELFDRTLLMVFYKLLGKRIVLTVHNVNAGRRDSKDTFVNRLTLRIQYRLADHIFVHTKKMKLELREEFGVQEGRVTVIPFGINNSVPNTSLTSSAARQKLGIQSHEKTILFFGSINPYKGLEYIVAAFQQLLAWDGDYRLFIVGRPNNCESYWAGIQEASRSEVEKGRITIRANYVPDEETELYFKAADVFVLPYRHIYQSGVLFLGYSFGLPVIAADVGALREEIVEGKTGFVFKPEDSAALAATIERYFASDLFANLSGRRQGIRDFASERHSWDEVGRLTMNVYSNLLRLASPTELPNREAAKPSPVD
jgi:glycosyltransferase involved in cell wall biosynthesis